MELVTDREIGQRIAEARKARGMSLQEGATTIERNQQIGGHKA